MLWNNKIVELFFFKWESKEQKKKEIKGKWRVMLIFKRICEKFLIEHNPIELTTISTFINPVTTTKRLHMIRISTQKFIL